jgi:hypothetical protein
MTHADVESFFDLLGRLRNFKLAEDGAADPQDDLGAKSPDERGR